MGVGQRSDVVRLEFVKDPLAALGECFTGCERWKLGHRTEAAAVV